MYPPGNQRHGFFVVHRHSPKRAAYISGCGDWIWGAIRAFGVHIDQTHLDGTEWTLKLPIARVAFIS